VAPLLVLSNQKFLDWSFFYNYYFGLLLAHYEDRTMRIPDH
jgi:hypothetical protein